MTQGVLSRAAVRRDSKTETAWPGTEPSAPGAGHGVPIRSESISKRKLIANRGLLQGGPSQEVPTVVGWECGGSITCDLRYSGLDRLFALWAGHENPALDASGGSPHLIGSGVYRHVYETTDKLENLATWAGSARHVRRGGLWVSKGSNVHRLWPFMVQGFTLSVEANDASVAFDVLGYDVTRPVGLTPSTWTAPADYGSAAGGKVALPHCRVYMGVDPGTITQEWFVRSLEIRGQNALRTDDYRSGSLYIDQPLRAGMREVRVRAVLSRYVDDTVHTYHEGNTVVAFRFDALGSVIAGGVQARLAVCMPTMVVESASDPVSGPGIITQEFELVAHKPTAVPSTWTTIGGPMQDVGLLSSPIADCFICTQNTYASNVFEE